MRPLNQSTLHKMLANGQFSVAHLLQTVDGVSQVEEKGLPDNRDLSKEKLIATLRTVRRSSRARYLQIMLMASLSKGATMNEIAEKLEEKPQSIHPLLVRLLSREALTREKRGAEFFYFLSPQISREDVEAQFNAIADGSVDNMLLIHLDSDQETEHDQFETNQLDQALQVESSSKDDRESEDIEMNQPTESKDTATPQLPRLPSLPEFNPNWDEKQQERWFALYEKIIALQERLEK